MAIGSNNYATALRLPTCTWVASGARANVLLNAAYVHGISGPGIAVRYQAREATAITELYVMLDDIGGTLANITMGCVLYNEHASTSTQPGGTVRATATAVTMPSAIDKWIRVVFGTPYTPTLGEVLYFVLRNTSSVPATDYPMIMTTHNYGAALNSAPALVASGVSTTNGFSAAGTVLAKTPFVVLHGANAYGQAPTITAATVYTSATTTKGFQFRSPVNVVVSGWQISLSTSNVTGLRIYDAAVAPGGSPLYTFPLGTDTNQSRDELIGAKVFAPVTLTANTLYNVVLTYGTAATLTTGIIEDYASFPAVFDSMLDYFTICPGVSDNAGAWAVRKDAFPAMQLLVSDFPATALAVRRPKVWNGSVWQEKPMGVWTGSVWEEQPLKFWNGSAWV